VLSFASVHKFALHEGCRSVPPCYHSHLFINLRYEGCRSVPPCYHSHLFISCVTRKVPFRPSVLSFASVHKFALHERVPFRPSVLSFASVHKFVLHEGAVRPSVHHSHLFINLRYTKGAVTSLRCYHSHLFINLRYTRVPFRPSVLFASVHRICVTRKGAVPSLRAIIHHLFINLRYTRRGVPPCYHSHLFIMLRYERGTSLRAIIRICS
jgi:hypothetical protein